MKLVGLLLLGFLIQQPTTYANVEDSLYGGIVKNRSTGEVLALKCVETNAANDCVGYQFLYAPSADSPAKDWTIINPNFIFHDNDLSNIESFSKTKMKYRVNPKGFSPPWFGGTMVVWNLIEQNRNSTGRKLPLWILYGIATPFDVATAIPIGVGTALVFGSKRLVIAVQGKNISNAFKKLEKKGAVKRLGRKNFTLIKTLAEIYPTLLN